MNLDPVIIDDLQATVERSHHYTGAVVKRAIKVILRQQAALAECHKEIFKLREAMLDR
jgi:hypothetical protein